MVKRVLSASGVLVLLALAVALVPQRGRASDVDNVLVVNGPKKPVPVVGSVGVSGSVNANVTNTPNVNVAGLPAVQLAPGTNVGINGTPNVNVANTPNVNVTGLPAVQLAGGTTVGIGGPVSLAASTVVGTTNADAAQAFQASGSVSLPDGSASNSAAAFTVPAGKRFVMEDFSGDGHAPTGQKVNFVAVIVGMGAAQADDVPIFVGPLSATLDQFSWGRLARLYADAGDTVEVAASRSASAGNATIFYHINGYLVNR